MNAKWMNLLFCFEDIKGPKKLFPDLPFGNMDSDRVEARKSLLESFLKVSICSNSFARILTPKHPTQGGEIWGLGFLLKCLSFAATLCHS